LEEVEEEFCYHFGQVELFVTVKRPDPTRPWRSFAACFSETMWNGDVFSGFRFVSLVLESVSFIVWELCAFSQHERLVIFKRLMCSLVLRRGLSGPIRCTGCYLLSDEVLCIRYILGGVFYFFLDCFIFFGLGTHLDW